MKRKLTQLTAALALLVTLAIPMGMWGQTTVASFAREGNTNTTTGGEFSTTFSAKSGYYQDNNGDCYMQILNNSAYWTTTPASISFAARIGGGSGNTDLTDPVYVSLLDANGDVISGTQTTVTSHITNNTGDNYTVTIPVTNNVSGVKMSHNKQSGYNVRYFSFSLSYVAEGGTQPTTYTVSFDAGDGTFVGNTDFPNATNTKEAGTYTLPAAERSGYTFDGWLLTGSTTPLTGTYTVSGDVAFTASYTENTTPSPIGDLVIDFESTASTYTDWTFTNLRSQQTGAITAHGSTYYGTNTNDSGNGVATASIQTTQKIATPQILTCYVSKQSTNTSASTWFIQVSSDGSTWTDVASRSASDMSKGEWKEFTADLSSHTNVYVRVYYSGSTAIRNIDDLTLTTTAASVATPTFSPEGGTYTSAQSVTISCATSGTTIYYTTDGSDPDDESTEYTGPIAVNESMIIKAIAYDNNDNTSSIATATYTIQLPLVTMDEIFAAAQNAGSTATSVNIAFGNWVVSGVSSNGKNVFVTDGTKGFVIFNSNGSMGFTAGDVLSGTVSCKVQLYNGFAELTQLSSTTSGLSVTTGGTVTPANIAMADLAGVNTGALVHYNNLTCSIENNNYYLSDGTTTIQVYNAIYAFGSALVADHVYNITGVYQQFNTTKEVLPRSAADIEEVVGTVAIPTFSVAAGGYVEAQTVEIACETQGATIYYTTDGTDPDDESQEYTGPITVNASMTIKAIAYDNNGHNSTIATVSYFILSNDNVYTVTEALDFDEYPANNVFVHGIVSTAPTQAPTNNGEMTYHISVDGTASDQLEVYKGRNLGNTAFTAQDDIQVGDIVTVFGNVVIYSNKKEFAAGNYLVEFERPAPEEYTLAIGNPEHITITAGYGTGGVLQNGDSEPIVSGTEITLALTIDEGYNLGELTVLDANNHPVSLTPDPQIENVWTFIMPSSNVNVTATAVEPSAATTAYYTLATTIESGKKYIIVGQADGVYYAMGEDKGSNRNAYGITLNGTTATATIAAGYYVHEFTISSLATSGFYSIYDALEPGYLYAASSTGNQLKTEAELDANHNGDWEISINAETGIASVVASQSDNRNVMQFNNNNILFNCYSSASQHPVYLYVKQELNITGYGSNAGGYYLIASPVTVNPADVQGMTDGNFDLYYFDEAQEEEWINYEGLDGGFDLVPGKGYLYAHDTDVTLTFSGTPYNGEPITLQRTEHTGDEGFEGWNLVGNPYAVPAYIDRDFYVMNANGSEIIKSVTDEIAPMQGIFVVAATNGETLTFSTEAPTNTGNKIIVNVSDTRSSVIDRAMVRFGEGRTLPKFMLNGENTKIYITEGNEDFAVVRSINENSTPVSFHAAENGTYTLSVTAENLDFTYFHLIDNMTGADVDLLSTPSYSFEASTTDYAQRFRLVYATFDSIDENNANNFAFFNGTEWVVNNEGEATLQVVDVTGRLVSSENVNGTTTLTLNQPAGIYMLRLVNGNDVKVQKVVVR